MASIGPTFQTCILQPQPGQADTRWPDFEVPESMAGYRRSEKTLVAAAVRDVDQTVVGVSGGWLMTPSTRQDVLLLKAAEVNEPYAGTGLDLELIEVLTRFAKQQGILQVCVPADLQGRPAASPSAAGGLRRALERLVKRWRGKA